MIKYGEFGRYGAMENVGGAEATTADALAGQLAGSGSTQQENSNGSPAHHSTAPYKPPRTVTEKARAAMNKGPKATGKAQLCADPECVAFASKDSEYCVGHTQKLGLIPAEKRCNHEGCKGYKQKGREYCRWHHEASAAGKVWRG